MYLLVKFLRGLSIVCNFQDSDDIVWWVHYSCLYDIVIQGYFRWDPISMYGNFSLHFPTMAPETSADDALGVYGAFGVHDAKGNRLEWCPSEKIQNVPFLEW